MIYTLEITRIYHGPIEVGERHKKNRVKYNGYLGLIQVCVYIYMYSDFWIDMYDVNISWWLHSGYILVVQLWFCSGYIVACSS